MAKTKQAKKQAEAKAKAPTEIKDVKPTETHTPDTAPAEPAVPSEPVAVADEVVTDEKGKPLFKRAAPKMPAPAVPDKQRQKASYKARESVRGTTAVTSNASELAFPTDRWGVTKDIKKAIISTASRIAGDDDKLGLVEETLEVLIAFIKAKHAADKAYKVRLAERAAEAEAE